MKRIIVVGALTCIGYHLVQKFLEEEAEVYAFDFDNVNSMSKVSEEKLCLIGRNALFTYSSLTDESWSILGTVNVDVVYVCLCEPNQQKDFRNERKILQYVRRFKHFCLEKEIKCIVLSSIEVTHTGNKNENNLLFSKIESVVKKDYANYCIFRVPTVYGPWQPSFMAYHQIILSQMKQQTVSFSVEECTCDLLYVEDVARCLYEFGQRKMEENVYSLCSGEENKWQRGIAILQGAGDLQIHHKDCQKGEGTGRIVENQVTLEEGMQHQISHLEQYKELYEESNTW